VVFELWETQWLSKYRLQVAIDATDPIDALDHYTLLHAEGRGYTFGMKTAVSIPDDIFEKAERFAKRANRSRSEVFAAALREYVSRHSPDEITDAMNRVCSELGDQRDEFVNAAGQRLLRKTEW
jgi:metal-responsive CopG/Arc/MetJ family transcriptional regulator